ncbi:hypothetical protein [Spirosoma foliorum]|uniref:Uncharacterized protein n=1 Tax=Spirosoma foliorum TaxID=2710596 RepID=A0A7G5H1L4_9BACT|nr:hypothetical protein [Spirosoma foliorum]QMW05006.1 hypothetical protein H3H32_08985 [Spirosoma foliorum]
MKKLTLSTDLVNAVTFLTLLLIFLWAVSWLLIDYALVFADFIQDKLPSTQALVHWVTVS